MNFELLRWNDDRIVLTHWDSYHGDDITLILNEDGSAAVFSDDGDIDTETPVDPVLFLRRLVKEGPP